MLFLSLWACQDASKTMTRLITFHLVHGVEVVTPNECEIPTLHTTINLLPDTSTLEQHHLSLEHLDEYWWALRHSNEAYQKQSKAYYNQ